MHATCACLNKSVIFKLEFGRDKELSVSGLLGTRISFLIA